MPHSGPFARGIHITVQAALQKPRSSAEVQAALAEYYRDRPFVRQTIERRELTASSAGAKFWHVRRLVPVQHIPGRIEIADLA